MSAPAAGITMLPLPVLPTRLDAGTYIGPAQTAFRGRSKYSFRENLTTACEDRIHPDGVAIADSEEEEMLLRNPRELVDKYSPMIEEHVEKRVAVAFQQYVLSYGTGLHFEVGDTSDQGESAPALHIVTYRDEKGKLCTRNAAHSSTIPCVIAYDGNQWMNYQNRCGQKPEGFVYVKGSYIYASANATSAMPRMINEADIAIDGKKKEQRLRTRHLELMNRVSAGELTPVQALQRFIDDAKSMSQAHTQLVNNDGVRRALEIFAGCFGDIGANLDQNQTFVDHLLGLKIDFDNDSALVRKRVYQLRYKAIQDGQLAESKIVEKVQVLSRTILTRMGRTKKPDYFNETVRVVLAEQMGNESDRRILSKLFHDPDGFNLRPLSDRAKRLANTKALVEQHLNMIHIAAYDVRREFRALQRDEVLKRGSVTKVLRGMKRWTQQRLAEKIRQMYPVTATSRYTPASQTTISRVENNVKWVDEVYATQLAKVYQVDPALFMPSFFYS
jgi:hypothetical protein